MSVVLSPVGGVAAQFFTNSGAVLTGGKIYTYAAGTSTPEPTYTTASGTIAHTNPIVLDAAGRVPDSGEIWLTDGVAYKFVLKTSTDVLIATYDNISGINSNFVNFTNDQEIQTATAGQTVFTLTTMAYLPGTNSLSVFVDGVNQYGPGASYAYEETNNTTVTFASGLHVGAQVKFSTTQLQGAGAIDASQVAYDPPFTGSVATNVKAKLAQTVSVKDFGAIGDGVVDDTVAIQAALDSGATSIYLPDGTYKVSAALVISANGTIVYGAGMSATTVHSTNVSNENIFECVGTGPDAPNSKQFITIKDLTVQGTSNGGNGIYFEYCVDSTIERVQVKNCGSYGIFTDNAFSNSFRYCRLIDNENHNMRLGAASNQIVVIGCRFQQAGTSNNKSGLQLSDGYGVSIIGCSMESNNIGLEIEQGQNIAVIGCYFEADRSQSIRIGSSSAAYDVSIQDCYMDGLVGGVPTASYSILISNSSENISITNTTMGNVTVQHIAGTYNNLLTFGNRFFGTGIAASSQFTTDVVHTNQIVFPSVQVPSTNVNTLDDYAETGSTLFTPGLSFGGGTTGIAYSTQSGRFVKIGRLVYASFIISLSNKGSSTGAALVTGLPFTSESATAVGGGTVIYYANCVGLTSMPNIALNNGATTAKLYMFGATNPVQLTDANFANNSVVQGTLVYEATD